MRIGFELDGVISTPVKSLTDLSGIAEQKVLEGVKEVLKMLKDSGHDIVIFTKRDVSTALDTERWLDKNKIPYDQIMYNRPSSMALFFTDNNRQFVSWTGVKNELVKYGVLQENEKTQAVKTIRVELPTQSDKGNIQKLK